MRRGKHIAIFGLASMLFMQTPQTALAAWVNPYQDVNQESWVYPYVSRLNQADILPDREIFAGSTPVSRMEFVETLYAAHCSFHSQKATESEAEREVEPEAALAIEVEPEEEGNIGPEGEPDERAESAGTTGETESEPAPDPALLAIALPFTDIAKDNPAYAAIAWAYTNDVTRGSSETRFTPHAQISREAACTMLVRFARAEGMKLVMTAEPDQFVDSLDIRVFARTPVLVCRMAELINGYEDGYFYPDKLITRNELAVMLCRLFDAAANPVEGAQPITFEEGAHDGRYATFKHAPVPAVYGLVPACDPVDLSYFADAVFVGDSVSLRLQYYCQSTQALGNATFLCSGSLSAYNALLPVSRSSFHPSYKGQKMLVEDGVAACQAKKVYIMLGMNSISFGVDRACSDMVKLIDRIQEKSPDAAILVQSVTPIAAKSRVLSKKLNNSTIESFNQQMEKLCQEHNWYFVDVGRIFRNQDGYLDTVYCSDLPGMGLHFTTEAATVWVEYLKTHVPLSVLWPCE